MSQLNCQKKKKKKRQREDIERNQKSIEVILLIEEQRMIITLEFSLKIMQAKREWSKLFTMLKGKLTNLEFPI